MKAAAAAERHLDRLHCMTIVNYKQLTVGRLKASRRSLQVSGLRPDWESRSLNRSVQKHWSQALALQLVKRCFQVVGQPFSRGCHPARAKRQQFARRNVWHQRAAQKLVPPGAHHHVELPARSSGCVSDATPDVMWPTLCVWPPRAAAVARQLSKHLHHATTSDMRLCRPGAADRGAADSGIVVQAGGTATAPGGRGTFLH